MSEEGGLGLRLIIGYKLFKATVQVALGALLLSGAAVKDLHQVAAALRDHATAAWSMALADRLVHAADGRHLKVVAVAAFADALFSAFEGWALHRRFAWSRWLVVLATSSLLPFEAFALVKRFTIGRLVLLTVNALIVVYLIRRRVTAPK